MASQTDQMKVPRDHTSSSKIFLTQTAVYLKSHSLVRLPCDKYTQGNPSLVVVILKVPRGLIILQCCCKPCQDALLNQSLQNPWAGLSWQGNQHQPGRFAPAQLLDVNRDNKAQLAITGSITAVIPIDRVCSDRRKQGRNILIWPFLSQWMWLLHFLCLPAPLDV